LRQQRTALLLQGFLEAALSLKPPPRRLTPGRPLKPQPRGHLRQALHGALVALGQVNDRVEEAFSQIKGRAHDVGSSLHQRAGVLLILFARLVPEAYGVGH